VLYQLHEWQRRLLNPMSTWAQATSELFSNPYSPLSYTPYSRRLAASYDLLYRLGKHYEKPAFGIKAVTVDGAEVPVRETVAAEKPFCRLLHFERDAGSLPKAHAADPRVLVVAPLSGHHSSLLRDTVRALLPAHDLYITDWTDARMVPLSQGPFHLDDYVDYVIEFLDVVGAGSHVISVCQPTVPVLAAVSLMAARGDPAMPKSMTMMGGPIDTRRNPTQVNALAQRKPLDWFRNNVIFKVPSNYPGYLRQVYPGFLQHAGFVAMNPDRHVNSHWEYYLDLIKGDQDDVEAHRRFYDEYNAVLDLPAEYYLDTIRIVFQEHRLPVACGRRAGGARGHPQRGPLHDRGRTGRHLRERPDQGRARAVPRHTRTASASSDRNRRGPLRDLFRPPLARNDQPADRTVHPSA